MRNRAFRLIWQVRLIPKIILGFVTLPRGDVNFTRTRLAQIKPEEDRPCHKEKERQEIQ